MLAVKAIETLLSRFSDPDVAVQSQSKKIFDSTTPKEAPDLLQIKARKPSQVFFYYLRLKLRTSQGKALDWLFGPCFWAGFREDHRNRAHRIPYRFTS